MENENNKYYTPSIEEFHVGFEFEYLPPLWTSEMERVWIKYNWNSKLATIGLHDNYISIGGVIIKEDCLRVKHLDKEDIEELGWKMVWNDSHGVDYTYEGKWQLSVPLKGDFIQIFKDRASYFKGTIKNKSELIRLMKQLGICTDQKS